MVRKTGKYGTYLACSNYPACSNIKGEGEVPVSDMPCPKCGSMMLIRSGKFGKFLACPNYPTCKSTLPFEETKKEDVLEGTCPLCKKPAKRLFTKTGRLYYGCTGYPTCKFMSWDEPTGEKCPQCGEAIVRTKKGVVKCSNRDCAYTKLSPEENGND